MPLSGEHERPSGLPRVPETRAYLSNHAESQVDNMELKLIAELAYRYWEDRAGLGDHPKKIGFEPSTNSKGHADIDSQPEPAIPFSRCDPWFHAPAQFWHFRYRLRSRRHALSPLKSCRIALHSGPNACL